MSRRSGSDSSRARLLLTVIAAAVWLCLPGVASAALCTSTHWIGAWEAAPSDASAGDSIEDLGDPSAHVKLPVDDETIRAILTPTYGGSTIRVHLSNRFGATAVTFGETTIAFQGSGASLGGPATVLTFDGGSRSVTVGPGQDVVSDPIHFRFTAFQTLAVSMFVADDPDKPTEHYSGRPPT